MNSAYTVTLAATLLVAAGQALAADATATPPPAAGAQAASPPAAGTTSAESSSGSATASTAPQAAPAVPPAAAAQTPLGPDSFYPMLVGAQYTFILQHQSSLRAPYSGPLSLKPDGDTQPTNTLGLYGGWSPVVWGQLYLDLEKFNGAGVSNSTGLAGLTNGDVVREGAQGVRKDLYIARLFARFMLPLGGGVETVDRSEDHIPGTEAARRLELKVGRMAAADDFDENRYANSPRTQFMNWSLMNNTAWDYAANTRGYTDGVVVGYISPTWSLKYGIYKMPQMANGEALVSSLAVASGQNLELTLSDIPGGSVLRMLAYLNTASMGNYEQALAIAAATHSVPDIVATDKVGRQKHGFGLNAEQPLADNGDTGLFLRWGWDDGREESFAFTEVDNTLSAGVQISGSQWNQAGALLGLALVSQRISGPHREYLAAGGCGFLLCDGALSYGSEQILETYYRLQRIWPEDPGPVRWNIGPDLQYIRNPGYNRARGPVAVYGLRVHVEY